VPKFEQTIQSRADAIKYVDTHLPGGQVAFAHIDKGEFVAQLRERINHPKLINQGQTDFCGPAAALHALAKEDPVAYAKLGLDLYVTGKATVRGWTVEAGNLIEQGLPKDKGIKCCDWVMMASVRKNVGFGALTSVTNLVSGTLPFEIASSLKGLGYGDVMNRTSAISISKVDEQNLQEASALWRKGYRVILCVNDNMFKKPADAPWKPNHFCTLKSEVLISDTKIFCRVWQWGIDHKEPTADPSGAFVNLPRKEFMQNYFGFVAGGDYTKA
jgi:hypothetical protein